MEYNELKKIAKELGINPMQKREVLEKMINEKNKQIETIVEEFEEDKIETIVEESIINEELIEYNELQKHIELAFNSKLSGKKIYVSKEEIESNKIKTIEDLNKFIFKNKLH